MGNYVPACNIAQEGENRNKRTKRNWSNTMNKIGSKNWSSMSLRKHIETASHSVSTIVVVMAIATTSTKTISTKTLSYE